MPARPSRRTLLRAGAVLGGGAGLGVAAAVLDWRFFSDPPPDDVQTPAPDRADAQTPAPDTVEEQTPAPDRVEDVRELTRDRVGVPPGTRLTKVDGPLTITTSGKAIRNLLVTGKVTIAAPDVTIERCRILGGVTNWDGGAQATQPFTIRDSDLGTMPDGSPNHTEHRGDDGLAFSRYIAERCRIEGFSDGAKANGETVIRDCYVRVHQLPEDHNDAIQRVGGNGKVIVERCNLDSRPVNHQEDPGNACVFSADGPNGPTVVRGNLLRGGRVCVAMYDGGGNPKVTYDVTGNWFDRSGPGAMDHAGSLGGGSTTPLSQVTWEDNRWLDTGEPVPGPGQ